MFIQKNKRKINICDSDSKTVINQNQLSYEAVDNLLEKLNYRLEKVKNELSKFKIDIYSFELEIDTKSKNIKNILIS